VALAGRGPPLDSLPALASSPVYPSSSSILICALWPLRGTLNGESVWPSLAYVGRVPLVAHAHPRPAPRRQGAKAPRRLGRAAPPHPSRTSSARSRPKWVRLEGGRVGAGARRSALGARRSAAPVHGSAAGRRQSQSRESLWPGRRVTTVSAALAGANRRPERRRERRRERHRHCGGAWRHRLPRRRRPQNKQ